MPADTTDGAREEALVKASAPAEPAASQFRDADNAEAWKSELVIAIDGPSGSGKSSVAREVATRLKLAYLDTGAMYRALTWWVLETGTDPQDAEAVAEAAKSLPLELGTDPIVETVMCNGVDIREAIRSERVTAAVSAVASNPEARKALIAQQRLEIVSNGKRIVAEGRDITTVVAPDATVRILLTASEEVRKARRGEQLGGDRTSEQLEADVSRRDAADSRVNNFTEAAEGVDLVDSTDLDFEQTVAEVIRVIDETAARNHEQKQQEGSGDSGTEDDEQESGA
ncbi:MULTISPECIES: (d)CMP kinase [Rothia]|uniref:(d)CMP kinase n=1 Tax=Rothia TaxID=32207 RepID=UPI00092BCFD8|nr:(d)CMP kinase [Rothia kristinae]MBE8527016.1 (d)CMP kinase [Amycolatopsis sp. H6(2020)]SIM57204.1 cytidylate kinase [Mycobacteroides abscessus subsp. abscessus]MBG7587545.1 (d)CMP kinase [Rothia kristinae]MCA1170546.1 (d)CMP kinase [Rothia kristinae]MCT1357808.1 (d)CMP kinase [Rothia kristinae]